MEKDIFKCGQCGIRVSLTDSQEFGVCPKCSGTISRKNGDKVDRENLPPYGSGGKW